MAVRLSGDRRRFRCQELYDKIHALHPHALVSFKHGVTGTKDFYASERFQLQHLKPGDPKQAELWESLNPSWGYSVLPADNVILREVGGHIREQRWPKGSATLPGFKAEQEAL